MKKTLYIILLLWCGPVGAIELLGMDLAKTQRDEFRQTIKNAGVTLISEAGEEDFFDSYDSSGLLTGSSRLYLGFVKKDSRFAFAEYEFIGLLQPQLLKKLAAKYGQYQLEKGDYLTDSSYRWDKGAITITLKQDWSQYRTRLIYAQPQALQSLQQEYLSFQKQQRDNSESQQYNAY